MTKKLLKHENLYVILEALVPLSAISAKRMWINDLDEKTKKIAEFMSQKLQSLFSIEAGYDG